MGEILKGYISKDKSYKVDDYPYGFKLRTSIFYWIESKEGSGDRFCTYTINPKTGRPNKPKCGTYSTFIYMYLDDDNGHVKFGIIDAYNREQFEARLAFIVGKYGVEYLQEAQKANLRKNYLSHTYYAAPYEIARYSDEKKPEYKKWLADTMKHIQNCDFKDLVDHAPRPEEDKPDGEVKIEVKTTEYNG